MDSSKLKMVYYISERNGKSYFTRIGIGFVNSDGSLNLKCEAWPTTGEVHVRDYVPREEQAGSIPAEARHNGRGQAATVEL